MPYFKNLDVQVYFDITESNILKYSLDENEKLIVKCFAFGYGFASTIKSRSKKVSLGELLKFVSKYEKKPNN